MKDPTRDQMLTLLQEQALVVEFSEFDIEEAIYWFANDYHGGQASDLYAALCASPYNPGPLTQGPDIAYLYDCLVEEYAND